MSTVLMPDQIISIISIQSCRGKVDPAFFAVREKGPKWAFFVALINLSKTRLNKNRPKLPTKRGKISQQKRHFSKSALKNGRGGGIRTHDLTVPNRARYHLRYAP